jgi:hypothetical protein
MLNLNLISQAQKNEIKLKHIHDQLKKIDFILITATIAVAVMFLVSKIILQNTFNSVVEQTTLLTQNSQSYNIKVREINAKINSIEQIQKGFIVWTDLLSALSRLKDKDIVFSQIRLNRDSRSIKLAGRALTRDGLINFKKAMDDSAIFTDAAFPISNFLEKTDINFDISAKINLEKL